MEMIRRAVYEHHERMDGTGYPRGLKGDEISIAARIIAVADSFDAMTASRPYKERMDGKTAVEDIAKHTPSWYDSSVVQAFVEAFHAVLENAS
jgi:HD-GYP domain-containing protein (c-di-GMP phosphodiesterase class II)